jgi:hypothetical protein
LIFDLCTLFFALCCSQFAGAGSSVAGNKEPGTKYKIQIINYEKRFNDSSRERRAG